MYLRKNINLIRLTCCLLAVLFVSAEDASAQYGVNDTIVHEAIVYNGDTIELKTLSNFYLYSRMTEAQRMAAAKYNRLRNAVYVTYPYARRAGAVMNDINEKLVGITKKEDRKKYIESGINDLVLKPFSEKELLDKINEYINGA